MQFERVQGVQVEALGEAWAAFSPINGQTSLLNNESAAMLEVLAAGPLRSDEVVALLAEDCGQPAESLVAVVYAHWERLVDGGLVRPLVAPRAAAA